MISPDKRLCCHAYLILLLTLLVAAIPSPLLAGHEPPLDRHIEPVIIKGEKLGELLGRYIANIRLFAYRGNKYEAIPFQIDQRDQHGNWVWDNSSPTPAPYYDDAVEHPCLSQHDELVFMYADAGGRLMPSYEQPFVDKLLEIEIKDDINHTSRWVYATHYADEPPPLSDERYVEYQPEGQLVITPIYELGYSKSNIAVVDRMKLNRHSILDRTRIRGEVKWRFMIFKGTIRFDEESIIAYVAGYKTGPIRVVIRTVNHLKLKSGTTSPEVNSDHIYYKHHSEIPFPLSKVHSAKQLSMLLTSVYINSTFQTIRVNNNTHFINDQKTSGNTNQLSVYNEVNWMVLDGNNGSIVSIVTKEDKAETYLAISPYLNQYMSDELDNSTPEAGYQVRTITDAPEGDYVLTFNYLLSDSPYMKDDERKLLILIKQPLNTEVRSLLLGSN